MYSTKRQGHKRECSETDTYPIRPMPHSEARSELATIAHLIPQPMLAHDALLRMLALHDADTSHHSHVVSHLTHALATRLDLSPVKLEVITLGALLHDIGKTAIPTALLNKSGKLTATEWAMMRQHPEMGERIIAAEPSLQGCMAAVRHHHERWDGGGYPDNLSGEAIPLAARIIAVADTFAVITSARSYQAARSGFDALTELERCAGTQFDPAIVATLVSVMADGASLATIAA